jgi:glycosyltransferase involved in cell wall biosynthesis
LNVLYLSYTGLLEPLGQSQVLNYLRILAREHRIVLVTFEKPQDMADAAAMAAIRTDCEACGIRWRPQRYHRRPRMLATAWDLLVFTAVALGEGRRADLIHARSYIPSFVALVAHILTGTPFIFDMRAFWPDEMAAAGRLKAGSALFRLIKQVERICILKAAAVVSLTEAGVERMRQVYGSAVNGVRFAVIPTCVDLARFQLARTGGNLKVVGSVGSVLSGWFRFEWLAGFVKALGEVEPGCAVRIVTREDQAAIRERLARGGAAAAAADKVEVFGVAPAAVPEAIAGLSAAAMFFETGVAKLGSCPTRMGELLASGLPVVANPGVGDVGGIIERYRVGVLVNENTDEAMRAAVVALKALLKDPELPARCRQAAEDWFSLEKGAATYARLYDEAV